MPTGVPDVFRARQVQIENQIRAAFRGVSRSGGVSWTESEVIDGDGSERTRDDARAADKDQSWEELVDDANWNNEAGFGGFNFLDPIGYRYYIAPAMIRCTREGGGEFTSYALRIDGPSKEELASKIDAEQAHAIACFVRFMIAVHAAQGDSVYGAPWSSAYKLHWRNFDRGTPLI